MFMWSASASDSSIVIGPTSRRTRPRLSRRRVLSRGSCGSSVARRRTSTRRVYSGAGGLRSAFARARWRFASSLRSRAAAVGFVGLRLRGTARASRSFATRRSTASSRLRAWLRSSCATARMTLPAFATTRRFWVSVSALEASTSNSAWTRVEDFCACWPPGPLERETRMSISETGRRTERVTRITRSGAGEAGTSANCSPPSSLRLIDSRSMACILLDIDGVLHVSGEPIPGASDAVSELRRAGHSLRFVTNNSTRPRARLAEDLREMGFTLEPEELQTTPGAAVRELEGKRVLALVMPAIVADLEGIELVGDHAEAVLIGGCDETIEPNQVFSYMNLSRAFSEIQMGASLYCLHKNKWWQTSIGPMLDSGAFVAGLEYATGVEATVLGKPSPSYFAAALDALGAEPELTWLVTDDVEADVRGARLFGMKTALVRTGKFRPETLESSAASPDIVVSSVAQFPALLEDDLHGGL